MGPTYLSISYKINLGGHSPSPVSLLLGLYFFPLPQGWFSEKGYLIEDAEKTEPVPANDQHFFKHSQGWARGHVWLSRLHATSYSLQTTWRSSSRRQSECWEQSQKNYFAPSLTEILPAPAGIRCCQDSCRKENEEKPNFSKVNFYDLNES